MKKLIATLLLSVSAFANADVPHQFKSGDAVSAQKFNENFSSIDQRLNSVGSIKLQVSDCGTGMAAYDVYVLGTSVSGKTNADGKMLLLGLPEAEYELLLTQIIAKETESKSGYWSRENLKSVSLFNISVEGGKENDLGEILKVCDELSEGGVTLDLDRDGFPKMFDCNDTNEQIHPRRVEIEDGIDNDCDGDIDEEGALIDEDSDGFYTGEYNGQPEDCDDGNPDRHPYAVELDNDIDDDCDGEIDEDFQ